MNESAVESPDPRVADLLRASTSTLRVVERSLSDLRVARTWDPSLLQSLERLALAFSGVMEAVEDPRFPLWLDAASAEQFSQTVNNLQGYFSSHPNDAPNIVPGAWQQVAALGSILRGSFIGNIRGRSEGAVVVADAAVGRLQRLLSDVRVFETQLTDLGTRQQAMSQEAGTLMATMNGQFLEQQRALEREWRDALKAEREAVSNERDTLRAEVEALRSQNRALHEEFSVARSAALASLEAARSGTVERLADYERQARDALGAVGSTAQSAQYQATADGAGSRRFWWQLGAVGCMTAGAVSLLCFIVTDPLPVEVSAGAIVGMVKRALFVALLGILSRYCAAMADGSRREQLWAHQRAVELRALGPYLEPFPPEERLKLRERLAEKYFGVGSTLLVEAATQGLPATGTHDVVATALKALVDKVPPDTFAQVVSVLAASSAKPASKRDSAS